MSGYRSSYNSHQGPPAPSPVMRATPRRSPFVVDEEEEEENYQTSLSRRRSSPISPGNRLYPNQVSPSSYKDFPTLSSSSPKSVRFSVEEGNDEGENNNNNNNASSSPATYVGNDSLTAVPDLRRRLRSSSKSGRSSTSSTRSNLAPSESLRRVSLAAAESVTGNLGTAAASWSRFVLAWGPSVMGSLVCALAVLAAVYAGENPDSGLARLFRTARDSFFEGRRRAALETPARLNLTRQLGEGDGYYAGYGGEEGDSQAGMGPVWRLYGDLLRDVDMESWFDEARGVDDVVSALWAGLPPVSGVVVQSGSSSHHTTNDSGGGMMHPPQPPITVTVTFPGGGGGGGGGGGKTQEEEKITGKSSPLKKKDGGQGEEGKGDNAGDPHEQDEKTKAVMRRLKMRSAIDMRSTMRKRAEAYFENFLAGRAAVVGRALDDARRFGELVELYAVNSPPSTSLSSLVPPPPPLDNETSSSSSSSSAPTVVVVGAKFHADVDAKLPALSTTTATTTTSGGGWWSAAAQQKLAWMMAKLRGKKKKQADEEEVQEVVQVRNRTNYILSYAGHRLVDRLLEAHQELHAATRPEPTDLPPELKGKTFPLFAAPEPDTLGALADLRRARDAEAEFLGDLVAQSAHAPYLASSLLPTSSLSSSSKASALTKLIHKLERLERRLHGAARNLAWVSERLAAQAARERGEGRAYRPLKTTWTSDGAGLLRPVEVQEEDGSPIFVRCGALTWSQAPADLAASWARVVAATDEARGWAEAHARELVGKRRRRGENSDDDEGAAAAVLRRWRVRHCAGTSCHEDIVARSPEAIGSNKNQQQQKPLSGSDEDSVEKSNDDYNDTPAWRAVREKLCCGYSMHNEWADVLMYGDKQFTYQDLYSGQREAVSV